MSDHTPRGKDVAQNARQPRQAAVCHCTGAHTVACRTPAAAALKPLPTTEMSRWLSLGTACQRTDCCSSTKRGVVPPNNELFHKTPSRLAGRVTCCDLQCCWAAGSPREQMVALRTRRRGVMGRTVVSNNDKVRRSSTPAGSTPARLHPSSNLPATAPVLAHAQPEAGPRRTPHVGLDAMSTSRGGRGTVVLNSTYCWTTTTCERTHFGNVRCRTRRRIDRCDMLRDSHYFRLGQRRRARLSRATAGEQRGESIRRCTTRRDRCCGYVPVPCSWGLRAHFAAI